MRTELIDIKGIIFDYGGTLDTNGKHWAEVLWSKYMEAGVPISKEAFKESYVYGERMLAAQPLIKPKHNFYDVLYIKVGLHISYLMEKGMLNITRSIADIYREQIARSCYFYVLDTLKTSRMILDQLYKQHTLILVSNFYGNINEILEDFGLLCFFKKIIESSVVGVRKPDPAIFRLGVNALDCDPADVVVIGDSFSKDIIPAQKVGCRTIWLKGEGWGEDTDDSIPDVVITDLSLLPALLIK